MSLSLSTTQGQHTHGADRSGYQPVRTRVKTSICPLTIQHYDVYDNDNKTDVMVAATISNNSTLSPYDQSITRYLPKL